MSGEDQTQSHVESHDIRHLFNPISLTTLLDEYWAKKALHLVGHTAKFDFLFSPERFAQAMARAQEATASPQRFRDFQVRASFERGPNTAPGSRRLGIAPGEWRRLFDEGATICVNYIDYMDERLAGYAARIKAELGYPGAVFFSCYYSPRGAGFGTHFDARIATSLQIAGRKRWRYARVPVAAWPPQDSDYGGYASPERGEDPWLKIAPEDFAEVTLEQGDLLMLPAGTWHDAESQSEESLALNLSFQPSDPLALLVRVLEERLGRSGRWRGVTPVPPADGVFTTTAPAVPRALLEEVRAEVDSLLRDQTDAWREWVRATASGSRARRENGGGQRTGGDAPGALARVAIAVSPPPLFLLIERGHDEGGGETIEIFPPNNPDSARSDALAFDEPAYVAWFKEALRRREFTVGAAIEWGRRCGLDPDAVQQTLEGLMDYGVIEPR